MLIEDLLIRRCVVLQFIILLAIIAVVCFMICYMITDHKHAEELSKRNEMLRIYDEKLQEEIKKRERS